MIAIPRQLAPWKSQLALFPADIALVLGPMVARLSALIGGAPFDHAPEGLPDGFSGISGQGTYDRLLATEWLLLEELPDEFLRRAVSGEHLFLQRGYQAESAAKQTTLLFDAGPDQLGAPRLAQLAILITMARRAEDTGATLRWGIFQDDRCTLHTGLTVDCVRKLLSARRARPVSAGDIGRWMEVSEVRVSSEIWLAGTHTLMREAQNRKVCALALSDAMEAGPKQRIHVRAVASGAARVREAMLDAPSGSIGARILRDPFRLDVGGRAISKKIDARSNCVFAPDGRKLYVRGEAGTLITIPIPNSPRAKVPHPQSYSPPEGQAIVAVGQAVSKRRTIAVTQGDGQMAIHTLSKRGAAAKESRAVAAPDGDWPETPAGAPLRPLGVFKSKYCFIDAGGHLIELGKDDKAVKHACRSLASRTAPGAFAYVVREDQRPSVLIARLDETDNLRFESGRVELPPMPEDTRYYFSAFGNPDNMTAYSRQESRCIVTHNLKLSAFDIPRSHKVVGAVHSGDDPIIVALEEDNRHVEGLRGQVWEPLFSASNPIAHLAMSDAGYVMAYITEAGEVGLYSFAYKAMLLQIAAAPDG